MARAAKDGLSKHDTHGFRLTIGKKADGRPRLFWLGHNRFLAEYHAQTLRDRFRDIMRVQGRDIWTEDDEQSVLRMVNFFKAGMEPLRRQQALDLARVQHQNQIVLSVLGDILASKREKPAAEVVANPLMLTDATKAYSEMLNGKRVSESHKCRAKQVLSDLNALRPNCPLASIDFNWLDRLCDHYKARPIAKKFKRQMGAETVVTVLRYLRAFFVWLDDSSFGQWEAPRKLLRPFRVRASDLMTSDELRASATIEQFDMPTLVKLYKAASNQQRGWMLGALFLVCTQIELAVLTKKAFDLDAGTITNYRNKTQIEGRFWLPPELVVLLRKEFAKHVNRPLAFYTEEGNPVVWYNSDGQPGCDSVRLSWDRLRIKAEVPDALSFKYLRKFAGDYAARAGGEAMGQVALSHASETVLGKHYSSARDFEGFNVIQKKMHQELTVAGMFKVEVKPAAAKKKGKIKRKAKAKTPAKLAA